MEIPHETRSRQNIASDPSLSAWVSANAGSGKTFVLARRVIRLLLDGNDPSRILCLTFTKAAAAEMSNRVFEELGKWVNQSDAELAHTLTELTGKQPGERQLRRARTLFALALDTPGGLKIQTIHAFCEALLHQFPLEANVPGHFRVLEEAGQARLLVSARGQTIAAIEGGSETVARKLFAELLDLASDRQIEDALLALMRKRGAFRRWTDGGVDMAMAPIWVDQGLDPETDEDSLIAEAMADSTLDRALLEPLAAQCRLEGGVTNDKFAAWAETYLGNNTPAERFDLRAAMLLTGTGSVRKTLVTKAVRTKLPGLVERLEAEQERTLAAANRLAAWKVLHASRALFQFADAVLERYDGLKRLRGLADFDDLVEKSVNLLMRADVRQWVQYKLDRGIDHVLIDEAQDTSPQQWQIINAIVDEFHAGEGASVRNRTVFAVGDEKQSIYSFQGADPGEFSRQRETLDRRASQAEKRFEPVPLNLSFRSSPDLLDAVDVVFSNPANFSGLSSPPDKTVHEAIRRNDPGEVRIWPLYGREDAEQSESWLDPPDALQEADPQVRLAQRIAKTIAGWIERGEKLPGRAEKLRCGDILILVRRRDRFATAMVRALKEQKLSIAGADRLKLTEHIAVEDLMALGRAMVTPLDDLAIAGLLKSPLLGCDDDDLIDLCSQRDRKSLLLHLARLGDGTDETADLAKRISSKLQRWSKLAAQSSVHAFYSRILGEEGGRRALRAQFGNEAEEVIDAFLQLALEHDLEQATGLEGFLSSLVESAPEIKREIDMKRDEIRVITVHAAKGLEAPVVFLVDPCSPPFVAQHRPAIVEAKGEHGAGWYWQPSHKGPIAAANERHAEIERDAEAEYRRLLYVGMTRAADRLIVCGHHGKRAPPAGHWHAMITGALLPDAEEAIDTHGDTEQIWRSKRPDIRAGTRERAAEERDSDTELAAETIPDWLHERVKQEAPAERPLSPSRAASLIGIDTPLRYLPTNEEGSPLAGSGEMARQRGIAVHSLLQHLPAIAREERNTVMRRWVERNAPVWTTDERERTRGQVSGLFDDRELEPLFGPDSRGEAEIAGSLCLGGRDVIVAGQIDRLAVLEDEILVADYKTNRHPPDETADIPEAYVMQLGLYRALLKQIYPEKSVRCLLIWTETGKAMEIEADRMDRCLESRYP